MWKRVSAYAGIPRFPPSPCEIALTSTSFLPTPSATGYPPPHADPSLRSRASAAPPCCSCAVALRRRLALAPHASLRRHPQVPHRDARRRAPRPLPSPRPPTPTSPEDALGLKIRPLLLDGRQKEWTTGEAHDVTDRSFTIRRALRLNDALPGDTSAHWIWQPGPWLLVDRATGHITALHLPEFDPLLSQVVWFRDYAAYCGIATTAKGGLFAIVTQIGAKKAVVQKQLAPWPQPAALHPRLPAAAMAAPAHARHPADDRRPTPRLRYRRNRRPHRRGRKRRAVNLVAAPPQPLLG